jgi:hypothetical protein
LHKAGELPTEQLQREVEKELTGRDRALGNIKLYKSQIPIIEQALETAALMLGSDKSRGYCLEMMCGDFLAGVNLNEGDPDALLYALSRCFDFLPANKQRVFLQTISEPIQ